MALGTTNISTTLVRNTLGTATNKVGELCTHANINMWSKRKPVRDARISVPLSEVGESTGEWGLDIPGYAGDDTLVTAYLRPRGGASEPYRLGDFRGYDHNANMMIVIPSAPAELERNEFEIVAFATVQGGTSVALGDIAGDLRLGVMVYNSSGTLVNAASAAEAGGANIPIDLTGYSQSTLTFKFCLTNYHKAWETSGGMTALYEVPRELSTQNKNWTNVSLVDAPVYVDVPTFSALYDPNADHIRINVETSSYTGAGYIKYYDAGIYKGDFSINISQSGQVISFYDTDTAFIEEGKQYTVQLWLSATDVGAFDAETTFTVLSMEI